MCYKKIGVVIMDAAELMQRIMLAKYQQLCPECGARMTESDRVCENGMIFVWYRCSKHDCSGQWLQKTHQQPTKSSITGHSVPAVRFA